MFEYHGWLVVQTSAYDEEVADLDQAKARVEYEIANLEQGTGLTNLQWVNGQAQLHIAGFKNHRGAHGDLVIDTFTRIGEIAPGSYGLLYFRDDEQPGRENEFQVLAMRKGTISEQSDPFLSPCLPMIEDD
jgi:hypothetical protein